MSRPRAWWLVMLGRVVVLAVLASAAFALVRSSSPPGGARYVCPMHPDVRLDEPGVCPICEMALVEQGAGTSDPRPPLTATVEPRTFAEPLRVPAWVDADGRVTAIVYRDDLVGSVAGEPASFAPASAPGAPVEVTRSEAAASPWDRATARIQFDAAGLPPGEEGTLVLPARPRDVLVVPTGALLACPDGPCVVVLDPAHHHFVRRTVETGRVHLGTTAILAGLTAGEQVAVESAFFLAGEHAP